MLGAALALGLWLAGLLGSLEAGSWDWRVARLAQPEVTTPQIVLILLDQNSLDWARRENGLSWPWPRELYAYIVDFCRRLQVRSLASDVLFTEPSTYGVEDDRHLADASAAFGRFAAGSVFLGRSTGGARRWPEDIPKPGISIAGLEGWLGRRSAEGIVFDRATLPVPAIARNAAVLCDVHQNPDPDGVYRRLRLFHLFDGCVLPSLGLGAYLAAHPRARMRIVGDHLYVDDRRVPLDPDGRVNLRFRGDSGVYRTFSAHEVLREEVRLLAGGAPSRHWREALADKYVFFGFSAPGLYDLRPAPVGGVYPGAGIHATVLDNLLGGDFVAPVRPLWTILLVGLLSLGCAFGMTFAPTVPRSVLVAAAAIGLVIGLGLFAYRQGYELPLVVQLCALAVTIGSALVFNYVAEGRQRRFIKAAFKHYLSPQVIEELIRDPRRLELGGERRQLSIFFSDLEGFTGISEGLAPEALTALLNDFLTAMTEIIQDEGGTVDKYEGDAVIAFWNAPLPVQDHALKAVRAALRCQRRLAELRPVFRQRIGRDLFMRIGINSGPAVVGNLGSHERFDYTVLGDAVNLAARLEATNKEFRTYTMISEAVNGQLDGSLAVRELGRVAVVGRRQPVTVYEPMWPEDHEARRARLRAFARALALYYSGEFAGAAERFAAIAAEDPPAAAYARRCRRLAKAPPPAWQGVWVASTK